ncbi:transcriptional regulator [Thermoplasma volcanium]|uniref:Putative HTH-type transcriptional regulatory protein TV0294 n=1 Tax=Thermoplasma volcanium (strain ATCC 51530 / DSM 4299 / JCM 9571 / NBRC 15438 / GSS1) TaxID=273116 RepID=Y294_THEVO|nr:transcriptional regulator [Thermoplasma volcanium]Q97C11.2 RecName: Full=Putative HTH-type transcriptional regulatory protein TV0294 [Thermoplasma volcanium GSS1]
MEDRREALISKLMNMLVENGFSVSGTGFQPVATFDIVARRDVERYILKVLYNIDTLKQSTAYQLIKLAKLLRATAAIIGERTGNGQLEDGVVYYRHGVPISSVNTFESYLNGERPYIYSGPGGFYVRINGELLRERRNELNLSIGNISSYLGVSRRSVSLYENGSAATIDIFIRLRNILKADIVDHIDLFRINSTEINFEEKISDEYIARIIWLLQKYGLDTRPIFKVPFDIVAKDSDEISLIAALIGDAPEPERVRILKKISDVFEDDAFLVSKSNTYRESIGGCAVLTISDLESIEDKDALIGKIEKRAK